MELTTAVGEDFDGFYAAHFRDTVAMAYTLTADLGEAQDIAQEAFSRAWGRWPRIRGYENPVAWVRHVAANLARSRWRRMKVVSSRLARLSTAADLPELNPDHVAVVAALRKLSPRQREALVLHHMMDLPVTEVAEHFEVPVGTVKSWLHRGRVALADDLRLDVSAAITTPPADAVKRRTRTRTRAAVVSSLAVAVTVAGTILAVQWGRDGGAPPSPANTPSPTANPPVDPADPMLTVDWRSTALTFPSVGGCPAGRMRVTHGEGYVGTVSSSTNDVVGSISLERVTIGDLNGDGRAEAVARMFCFKEGNPLIPQVFELAVFERHDDGTIHLLTITRDSADSARTNWIRDGVLYVHATPQPPVPDHVGELRAYRLTAGGLTRVGTDPYPPITEMDLTPVAARLSCGGAPPETDLRLKFGGQTPARAGGREFTILRPTDDPLFAERGRTGLPYLVLTIGCRAPGTSGWDSTGVVLDLVGTRWLAVQVR